MTSDLLLHRHTRLLTTGALSEPATITASIEREGDQGWMQQTWTQLWRSSQTRGDELPLVSFILLVNNAEFPQKACDRCNKGGIRVCLLILRCLDIADMIVCAWT